MPFVLFIIFGLWLLVICANDKGKHNAKAKNYYANYTEYRFQEEFLLAYELYMEYRNDPNREDPLKDAEIDAARQMYDLGYMPRHSGGRTYYAKNYNDTQTRFSLTMLYPDRKTLQNMRSLDMNNGRGVLCQMGPRDNTEQRKKNIREYNDEIDRRWCKIMERIAYEEYVLRRKWPLTLAEEYLIACNWEDYYRRKEAKKAANEDLMMVSRIVDKSDCGMKSVHKARVNSFGRPSSMKPVEFQDKDDCCMYYVPDVAFDDATFERLIEADRADWTKLGYQAEWSIYEEYVRRIKEYPMKYYNHGTSGDVAKVALIPIRYNGSLESNCKDKELKECWWKLENLFDRRKYCTRYSYLRPREDDFTNSLYNISMW